MECIICPAEAASEESAEVIDKDNGQYEVCVCVSNVWTGVIYVSDQLYRITCRTV